VYLLEKLHCCLSSRCYTTVFTTLDLDIAMLMTIATQVSMVGLVAIMLMVVQAHCGSGNTGGNGNFSAIAATVAMVTYMKTLFK